MKLMIIIIRDQDSEPVVQRLIQNNYRVTRMASSGGFMRRGNSTLLVGVEDERVDLLMAVLRKSCCPSDSENEHRATVFTVNMPYYAQI